MKNFRSFSLDPVNECLWRGDERLTLSRKTYGIARYLVDHAGRLVTKEELIEAVWPDSYVQEENLKAHIKELRRALGDQAGTPSFIETQRGRGYRFIAQVTDSAAVTASVRDPIPKLLSGRETELQQLRDWFDQAMRGGDRLGTGQTFPGRPRLGASRALSAADGGERRGTLRLARGCRQS